MLDYSIYLLYRAGSALINALPLRLLFGLGHLLGFAAWVVLRRYRLLAYHNLEIAFGNEKPRRELRRLVRRHFQRLGANLLSSVKISSLPLESLDRFVEMENAEAIHHELRSGRRVVLILSHLANWELCALWFPLAFDYARISSVYQKLRNRYIDEHVRRTRERSGAELFDRSAGFQKPIEFLRNGGLIGIFSDQHAGDHGLWTPFFGRLASTTTLPALLAKRTGAALMAAALYTNGAGRWKLIITLRFDAPGDSVQSLSAKVNEVIAAQIRRAPEDWFWVHNRWKTPQPNFLLARYKRGIYLPPPEFPSPSLKPFRILIRASNWLGDNVMSVPAVRAIKLGRPDAHVTIAVPAKIASVWRLVPEVDAVIVLPERSLLQTVRLLRREASFDAGILFPNSLRSALEVWLAGVPRRVGYRGYRRSWLLNQIVPGRAKPGPVQHQAQHYLDIARDLGAATETVEIAPRTSRPANVAPRRRIGLCPGAEYGPAKRWLPERFAEVAIRISEQSPVDWILFGTETDAEDGAIIAHKLGARCVNRIGKTTLDQLIAELRDCDLLLTNDTGTMHLATLIGLPVVAIFGSTDPFLTGPLGTGDLVVRHQVECSPCFLRECPIDFRCMRSVSIDEVVAAVNSRL